MPVIFKVNVNMQNHLDAYYGKIYARAKFAAILFVIILTCDMAFTFCRWIAVLIIDHLP